MDTLSSYAEKNILNTLDQILTIENDFFKHLNNLAASSKNDSDKKLLKKIKTIILNFFYIKSVDSTQTEFDSNFVRIIIDILNDLYPYYVSIFERPISTEYSDLYKDILKI